MRKGLKRVMAGVAGVAVTASGATLASNLASGLEKQPEISSADVARFDFPSYGMHSVFIPEYFVAADNDSAIHKMNSEYSDATGKYIMISSDGSAKVMIVNDEDDLSVDDHTVNKAAIVDVGADVETEKLSAYKALAQECYYDARGDKWFDLLSPEQAIVMKLSNRADDLPSNSEAKIYIQELGITCVIDMTDLSDISYSDPTDYDRSVGVYTKGSAYIPERVSAFTCEP